MNILPYANPLPTDTVKRDPITGCPAACGCGRYHATIGRSRTFDTSVEAHAYCMGYTAARPDDCEYAKDSPEAKAWTTGYHDKTAF